MYYIVDTTYHTRPYYTTLAFLAHDFKSWGWRVGAYESNSAYVATFMAHEQKLKNRDRRERIDIREIWVREIVLRANSGIVQENDRVERVASMLRDFFVGLVPFDDPRLPMKHMCPALGAHDIPPVPLGLVSMYMRLLKSVRYTMNAGPPSWSHPDVPIGVVDQVKLEFQNNSVIKRRHLDDALRGAMREHPRRIGRVEGDRCKTTVWLLVEVTEVVEQSRRGGEEDVDALPLYEVGEVPPVYEEE